jgi:hypothetical protein
LLQRGSDLSSTRRKKRDGESDNYPTPRWPIERFFEVWPHLHSPGVGNRWLEPAAGDGAIIEVANRFRDDLVWDAIELRDTTPALQSVGLSPSEILISDFFDVDFGDQLYDVAIFNPPFRLVMEFVETCRPLAKTMILFQTLNFMGSGDRNDWIMGDVPDCYVIPDRVSHTGDGHTDSVYSCWYVWGPAKQSEGKIKILPCTPKEERAACREKVLAARDERLITLDALFED